MTHTPGPWVWEVDDYGDELWFGGFGRGLFIIRPEAEKYGGLAYFGGEGPDNPQHIANARLIAAAPTMYSALLNAESVLATLIGAYGDSGAGLVLKDVQAAIARATGDAG